MKKLFHSKSKIHSNNVEADLQVKELLKTLEDTVITPLGKIIRSGSALLQAESKRNKDYEQIAITIEKLGDPNLSKEEERDANYVEAFKTFSDVLKSSIGYAQIWVSESNDKFISPSNTFYKVELTDHLKVLRKQYEKSRDDYSGALLKIDNYFNANKKKLDIEKLYALEKEKVRLRKTYEVSIMDLKEFCDDVYERINFDLMDFVMAYFEAKKKSLGLSYTDIDELKERLDELIIWCNEESLVFTTHITEREEHKAVRTRETQINEIKSFLSEFDTSTLAIIRPIGISNEMHSQDISVPLSTLLAYYEMPIPEGLIAQTQQGASIENALEMIRLIVKNNIDAIGLALIANSKVDKLITLTETLAVLEKSNVN